LLDMLPCAVPVRGRNKVFKKGWTGRKCPVIEPSLSVVTAADGHIAQLVEQLTLNQRVVGSIPTVPTKFTKETKWLTSGPQAPGSAFGR
jgi:hypothetical protein